jgi:hypothetical protein
VSKPHPQLHEKQIKKGIPPQARGKDTSIATWIATENRSPGWTQWAVFLGEKFL